MNCRHDQVERDDKSDPKGPVWVCASCGDEFLPGYAVAGITETKAVEQVDMTVAVASAMLWDFHERAVEKYGKDSAEEEALRPGHDAPDECEPGDHIFDGDNCGVCGKSRWLGSE